MKINPDKIKFYIKQSGMTNKAVCERADISRTTLYEWCNGLKNPTETNLRKLSKIINAPISEISDLPQNTPISEEILSNAASSWLELSQKIPNTQSFEYKQIINNVYKMEKKLSEASLIIQGLLKTTDSIVYIKDTNSKYIIASKSFTDNLSLPDSYNVEGKEDVDFFSAKEAKKNNSEDMNIIFHGNKIIKKEEFIPGSRHKKWGLTSKLPIYDSENKILGILGSFIDITEKMKDEQLREILETGISEFSEVFTILDNKNGERLFTNVNLSNPEHAYMNPAKYDSKNFLERISVIHPEDRKKIINYHKFQNWPKKFKFRVIGENNDIKWIGATYKKIEYLEKSCTAALYRDITAKTKIEEFKNLFDSSINMAEDLISIVDKKTNSFVYVNDKFESFFGVSKDIFYENGLKYIVNNLIHKDSREEFIKSYTNINLKVKNTYKVVTLNNTIRWIETNSKIMNYENKECIITVSRDISNIIYILEQHSLLMEMADQTPDTIIWIGRLINYRTKNIHVSNNFEKLTGYTKEDIKASILSRHSRKELFGFIHSKGKNHNFTLKIKCRDNSLIKFKTQLYRKITSDNKTLISAILRKINN